jgi:hypothetical protein
MKPATVSASKEQRQAAEERRRKAVALRLAGTDYETIATQLGYASRGAAYVAVDKALRASAAEQAREAEVLRQQEIERLDRLQRGVWAKAVAGDPRSAEVALRIVDRRCKLLGLDAPQRHEVVTMSAVEQEIARLEAELADRAGMGVVGVGPDDEYGGGVAGP